MRLVALLLLSTLALSSAPRAACAQSSLVINELLAGPARDWDGSGAFSSRDDEWIEVKNVSASVISLDGYFLTDGDSIPRFALSGLLSPGSHRVIFGRESYDWERANGHPAFGFSLGNSGDEVILWHVAGPDTTVADRYAYRSHEAAADRAVGRRPDGGADWALFDGLNLYTGSLVPGTTGCMPTPGAPTGCGGTPARETTWGRVKTLYHGAGKR